MAYTRVVVFSLSLSLSLKNTIYMCSIFFNNAAMFKNVLNYFIRVVTILQLKLEYSIKKKSLISIYPCGVTVRNGAFH